MDLQALGVQVQWIDTIAGQTQGWDAASKRVAGQTLTGQPVTNKVRVTVTYHWSAIFLAGPVTLTGVSEVPMAY